jgi:aldehyde dehydrogenase (NAD+)
MLSMTAYADALPVPDGRMYINGDWVEGHSESRWDHISPATNQVVAGWSVGTTADAERAVGAARAAFDSGPWRAMRARERSRMLRPIVELIYQHADELNRLQVLDNAMPLWMSSSYGASAELAADRFDHHIGWIDKMTGDTFPVYTDHHPMQMMTMLDPVGVVAGILPWNAPLMQFCGKAGPALAAGCTIVMKPSEYAPLTTLRLAELIEQLDLPPGVFNLVLGEGHTVGEALITDLRVDKVNFTGSRAVGEHILAASGKGVRRVSLELGGKSPSLVFADADLEQAATAVMGHVSLGLSGQVCAAQTRALVDRAVYPEFVELCLKAAKSVQFGDPYDLETTSAPMINPAQLDKVMGYINVGVEEGATLTLGGDRPTGDLEVGNWVNPTIFTDVAPDMTIAREEIFGPVLSVIAIDSEDEAIGIANDSNYGLSAGIYTNSVERGLRVAQRLRTGTVGINDYDFFPNSPFGGYKASGVGREGGRAAMDAVMEVKTVMAGV